MEDPKQEIRERAQGSAGPSFTNEYTERVWVTVKS